MLLCYYKVTSNNPFIARVIEVKYENKWLIQKCGNTMAKYVRKWQLTLNTGCI